MRRRRSRADGPAPLPGRAGAVGRGALGVVASLPDRLPIALFCLALAASVAVLVGELRPVVVLPAAALLVALTWRLAPAAPARTGQSAVAAVGVLGAATAWVLLNAPYASEFLTVTRDPGFLTLGGAWLADHPAPAIEVPDEARALAEAYDDVIATPLAYTGVEGTLVAQGAKLLPALLGMAGWTGGLAAVLAGNLVIGALGLVAVYAVARRLAGPWWGLVAPVALALGMPMVVFSRAAYTEPLALALVFGGIAVGLGAAAGRRALPYLLAGAMVGASALARIDGAAVVVGLVLGIGLPAAAAVLPRRRRQLAAGLVLAVAGAGAMIALGYLDLRVHSPGYLRALSSELRLLLLALGGALLVVAVLVAQPWSGPRRTLLRHRRGAALVLAALVVAAGAVLFSRPWWQTERNFAEDSGYAVTVAALQERDGLPVDGTRTYDEWSLHWVAWYQGWPFVVLAVLGLAAAVWCAVRRRSPGWWLFVGTVAAPSVLYLWRISITPDQVWAMRRLLPVTLPGFAVAASVALAALWAARRWWVRTVAVLLAGTLVVLPLRAWGPMLTAVEQGGRLAEVRAVCDALPAENVVYVRAGGPPYLATLLSVCGVRAVELAHPPDAERLARIRERWGDEDLAVVAFASWALPWPDGDAPRPLARSRITWWQLELNQLPRTVVTEPSTVWVAEVLRDGTLVPARNGS
ncbi:hypothetical protein [Cellulomonas sp. PS-H5]|uniref:hypothetical protein n=1 Tax=Cellulomonas sp. PS-H5 TaxID=2820400 RepID=UPI001C4F8F19|nr:hypothetical protein [Cellulomonas sp. PS-H5]MBW0254638.1 hypothetical protein [Cellulomonas sp. PS-H5]